MLKTKDLKTVDDIHAFLIEQSMHGPREYTEEQATRIADTAREVFNRNPDPEPKKVADFIRGWKAAAKEYGNDE